MVNTEELKYILDNANEVMLSKKQIINLLTFSVKYPSSATTLAIDLSDVADLEAPFETNNSALFTYLV